MTDRHQQLRLLEAVLFATREPLSEAVLAERMPDEVAVSSLIEDLKELYANRGVNLVRVAGGWAFRTASDLASRLAVETRVERKLSRAAIETLAIIAYHQPVTRAEIEEIRGVFPSRGTLDILLEAGWIRPGRRRRSPGRPLTWVSTGAFLDHFGLESLEDLPGIEDLKATGLLDARPAIDDFSAGLSDAELAEEEAETPSGEEGDMARNAEDD